MKTYHKIQSVWLRDPDNKHKTFLEGAWSKPEFEYLKSIPWTCTEKIDGTNIRVIWDGVGVRFEGKTDKAQLHKDLLTHLKETFWIDQMASVFGVAEEDKEYKVVCLYGEGYGAGIQSGGYYRKDKSFILFDIKIGKTWLEHENVYQIAQSLNIPVVPIVDTCSLTQAIQIVRLGFNSLIAEEKYLAEGLICKPKVEMYNRFGERIITKIKHKDFGPTT